MNERLKIKRKQRGGFVKRVVLANAPFLWER